MTRRPAMTVRVIRGVIAATSMLLADDLDNWSPSEVADLKRADEWARETREWLRGRGLWPEDAPAR